MCNCSVDPDFVTPLTILTVSLILDERLSSSHGQEQEVGARFQSGATGPVESCDLSAGGASGS